MIILVTGPMGSGKNFIGQRIAEKMGYPFFDGDDQIPEDMKHRIENFKLISRSDYSYFVQAFLYPEILRRYNRGMHNQVVAQALYSRRDRQFLQREMDIRRVKSKSVYVDAPLAANLGRLYRRRKGKRWMAYGLLQRPFFQMSDDLVHIRNGTDLSETVEDVFTFCHKLGAPLGNVFDAAVGE